MGTMRTWYLDGDRFATTIRDHIVTVDQPNTEGGPRVLGPPKIRTKCTRDTPNSQAMT
jgi:hypothetical protein